MSYLPLAFSIRALLHCTEYAQRMLGFSKDESPI